MGLQTKTKWFTTYHFLGSIPRELYRWHDNGSVPVTAVWEQTKSGPSGDAPPPSPLIAGPSRLHHSAQEVGKNDRLFANI